MTDTPTTDTVPAGAGTLDRGGTLEADLRRADATEQHSLGENTRRNYGLAIRQWCDYADANGVPAFPALPRHVKAWAEHIANEGLTCLRACCDPRGARAARAALNTDNDGIAPAGLKADSIAGKLAGLAYAHREAGHASPLRAAEVWKWLKGRRIFDGQEGRRRRQAKPLTAEALAAVRATLRRPLPRGRGYESQATADRRATRELALVMVLRDAMLRRSEAAALRWTDVDLTHPDNTGRVEVRRSKTDATGEGATIYIGPDACDALRAWRERAGAAPDASVFGWSASQIGRVVRRACANAGLGDGYTGHSGRVGFAVDLVGRNIELGAIAKHGRWKTSTMAIRYSQQVKAGQSAAAIYYATVGC